MGIRKMEIYPLIFLLFLQGGLAHKERFWHEETSKFGDVRERTLSEVRGTVLFPRSTMCVRPQQETKSNKRGAKREKFEGRWSQFLGLYYFDYGFEIHNWEEVREVADPKVEPWTESASLILIIIFLIIFLVISTVVIPVLGWMGFIIYRIVWWLCTHPYLRVLARRFWIYNEQRKRRREKWLYSGDKAKLPKFRPILPKWLRDFAEEEMPADLVENEVDSDGGESSDGFEAEHFSKEGRDAVLRQSQFRNSVEREGGPAKDPLARTSTQAGKLPA